MARYAVHLARNGRPVAEVGYVEAWQLWLSGQEVDAQAALGPLTILWWGRLGKVLAFVGGLTVILDLVGSQRLRRLGRERKKALVIAFYALGPVFIIAGAGVASAMANGWLALEAVPQYLAVAIRTVSGICVLILVAYLWRLLSYLVQTFLSALDKPNPAFGIRVTAAALIILGFHLDLLAS